MADTVKTIFNMCWDFFQIEIQLFEYTVTLQQVLFFAIIAYGLAVLVFDLIFDRFGDGGDSV